MTEMTVNGHDHTPFLWLKVFSAFQELEKAQSNNNKNNNNNNNNVVFTLSVNF